MAWEPTIGKWYDDENYDMKEPLWLELLALSARYGDHKRLREILSWFGGKNIYGDDVRILLIGCFLYQAGADLEEWVSKSMLSEITELAKAGDTLAACAAILLEKKNVDEEFIDQFHMQFADK